MKQFESLIEHLQDIKHSLSSIPTFDRYMMTDCENVSKVALGQTLARLSRMHYSKLSNINGPAIWDGNYDQITGFCYVWLYFKFEQQGKQIRTTCLSTGETYLDISMSSAKNLVRRW